MKKIALIIFGVFSAIIFIEVALQVGGFVISKLRECKKQIITPAEGEYRFLCIGESTTELGGEESYPKQLEKILNARGGEKYRVINEGAVACNTTMILKTLDYNLEKYKPHMVIAMMGINDRYLNIKFDETEESKKESFLKNLKLGKLFKWLNIFSKSKTNRLRQIDIKGQDKGENINKQNSKKNIVEVKDPAESAKHEDTAVLFKNETEINSNIKKAIYLRERGRYEEAMTLFKEELKKNPRNYEGWEGLWLCYLDQRQLVEAEEIFLRQLKMSPDDYRLQNLLGNCYREQRKFKEAESVFKKLIENANSNNPSSYINLGILYEEAGEFLKEKSICEKAIENGVEDATIYKRLGDRYWKEANYNSAEKMYLRAMELIPESDYFLSVLGSFYFERGRYPEAEALFRKAGKLRDKANNEVTLFNYLKLQNILKEKGIKLVCMQYPMRSIEKLRDIFPDPGGIIFVDNEMIFRKALRTSKYEELFSDKLFGDFGHCTPKGNRLIANNLLSVILAYFEKRQL